jgi:hypothetical protein
MPNKTKILYGAGGIVLLGVFYYFFFVYNGATQSAVESRSGGATAAESQFISLVGKIDPITFDTSILTNTRFVHLEDIRTTIIPEPAGRKDPFAPFAGLLQ